MLHIINRRLADKPPPPAGRSEIDSRIDIETTGVRTVELAMADVGQTKVKADIGINVLELKAASETQTSVKATEIIA